MGKHQDEEGSGPDRVEDRRGLEGWQHAGSHDTLSLKSTRLFPSSSFLEFDSEIFLIDLPCF